MTLNIIPTTDIAQCHEIRRIVFIEGQNVPKDIEVDGKDSEASHLLAFYDDIPVGTARVLVKGHVAKIGRVAVLSGNRGRGIGAAVVKACTELAREKGATKAILGAQTHAITFYENLGYTAYGDIFDDAGIPHRMMEINL